MNSNDMMKWEPGWELTVTECFSIERSFFYFLLANYYTWEEKSTRHLEVFWSLLTLSRGNRDVEQG